MPAVVDLLTLDTDHLNRLRQEEIVASLDQMSGPEIAKFRRLRKIDGQRKAWLELYLRDHPEKRVAEPVAAKPAPARKNPPKKSAKRLWIALFVSICLGLPVIGYVIVRALQGAL